MFVQQKILSKWWNRINMQTRWVDEVARTLISHCNEHVIRLGVIPPLWLASSSAKIVFTIDDEWENNELIALHPESLIKDQSKEQNHE